MTPPDDGFPPEEHPGSPDFEGPAPEIQGMTRRNQGLAPEKEGMAPENQGPKPENEGKSPQNEGPSPENHPSAPEIQGILPFFDEKWKKGGFCAQSADFGGNKATPGRRHTNLPERDCVRRTSRSAWMWMTRGKTYISYQRMCCGWSATQPRSGKRRREV